MKMARNQDIAVSLAATSCIEVAAFFKIIRKIIDKMVALTEMLM